MEVNDIIIYIKYDKIYKGETWIKQLGRIQDQYIKNKLYVWIVAMKTRKLKFLKIHF